MFPVVLNQPKFGCLGNGEIFSAEWSSVLFGKRRESLYPCVNIFHFFFATSPLIQLTDSVRVNLPILAKQRNKLYNCSRR